MTEPLCTCGKRPKHKCSEESGVGGKMCLRPMFDFPEEYIFPGRMRIITQEDILDEWENGYESGKMCLKLDWLLEDYEQPEVIDLGEKVGAEIIQDFINSQEELGNEFEKILADNLSDLYLE